MDIRSVLCNLSDDSIRRIELRINWANGIIKAGGNTQGLIDVTEHLFNEIGTEIFNAVCSQEQKTGL